MRIVTKYSLHALLLLLQNFHFISLHILCQKASINTSLSDNSSSRIFEFSATFKMSVLFMNYSVYILRLVIQFIILILRSCDVVFADMNETFASIDIIIARSAL